MNFLLVECNLYCRDGQSNYYNYRGPVDSGTHCNKDTGACVDNTCVPMSFEPGKDIFFKLHLTGQKNLIPPFSLWMKKLCQGLCPQNIPLEREGLRVCRREGYLLMTNKFVVNNLFFIRNGD